jgi:hypothetical protein
MAAGLRVILLRLSSRSMADMNQRIVAAGHAAALWNVIVKLAEVAKTPPRDVFQPKR